MTASLTPQTSDRAVVPPATSRLLKALEAATRGTPTARKRLVGPDVNYGRELLVALAARTGGWLGWEATNLRGIADELAFVSLHEAGRRVAGDVEIGALVGLALDRAIEAGRVGERFAQLERGFGFRRAVRDAVLEARVAGLSHDAIRAATGEGTPARELAAVLEAYERLLAERALVDVAGVFAAALDAFDDEAPFVLDGEILIAPTLAVRGLPARLLARLVERGARVLAGDAAFGVEAPASSSVVASDDGPHAPLAFVAALELPDAARIDDGAQRLSLFAAATPSDEIREVMRRAVAEGLRWDEVEIVTTDPDAYGIALDAVCGRLGVGATMLHGVPLARTRLGRAIDRWLRWLEDGLPADLLREALEAGELELPGSDLPSTALARELRRLQVGWGRARYESAVATLATFEHDPQLTAYDDETPEELAARVASRRRSAGALRALLVRVLELTPAVPERGSDRPVRCSAATLVRATLAWLDLLPVHGMAERQTVNRLRHRLEQLAELATAPGSFAAAMAALRDTLADLRAWPVMTDERKPWSAAGGMLHLTDLAHAGTTGRRRTFVVGLDADRTAGPTRQDPLLTDAARASIAPDALPTTAERRAAQRWLAATQLAGLRGTITLSYATSASLDGREAGPSPLLLQAWRLATGDREASFESLREALLPPACAVPATGGASLDARDAWLDAIADGALLLDGSALVRECYAGLRAGLEALDAAAGAAATEHHGVVRVAGRSLDPRSRLGRAISPSALEQLAKCPLSWFYRYGVSIRPPADPEYDAERWLDALDRGSLLHQVYERVALEYRGRRRELLHAEARERVLAIANATILEWRERVPPPAETVFEGEAAALRHAAVSFLELERQRIADGDDAEWERLEYEFGVDGAGTYPLGDGEVLPVKGKVDRIDRLADGTLRVMDYKTGSAKSYAKGASFNGGRQLQPAIYAAAVERLLATPVSRFEYVFPTERGQNSVVTYEALELEEAREVIRRLLDQVREGSFVPTDDPADCSYCDYQPVCRASRDARSRGTKSPRAAWAAEHGGSLEVYAIMRGLRGAGVGSRESGMGESESVS